MNVRRTTQNAAAGPRATPATGPARSKSTAKAASKPLAKSTSARAVSKSTSRPKAKAKPKPEAKGKARTKPVSRVTSKATAVAPAKARKAAGSTRSRETSKSRTVDRRSKGGTTQSSRRTAGVGKRGAAKKHATGSRKGARKTAPPPKPAPKVAIRVRDLDPQAMCGEGTSVERLIRVDQVIDRALEAHLVYFDRHGWYCEHGVTCPAVSHARRHAKQVRSEYGQNATHNGRMRA